MAKHLECHSSKPAYADKLAEVGANCYATGQYHKELHTKIRATIIYSSQTCYKQIHIIEISYALIIFLISTCHG